MHNFLHSPAVYLAGALLLSLRLIAGLFHLHQLRRTAQPAAPELAAMLDNLCRRLRIT